MINADREARINRCLHRMLAATTKERKRFWYSRMCRLIRERTPAQVFHMEQKAGLR